MRPLSLAALGASLLAGVIGPSDGSARYLRTIERIQRRAVAMERNRPRASVPGGLRRKMAREAKEAA